jgi:uncharacterized coiled-coil DUF342 family protein
MGGSVLRDEVHQMFSELESNADRSPDNLRNLQDKLSEIEKAFSLKKEAMLMETRDLSRRLFD